MKLNLLDSEKRTFRLHLAYSILEGIIEGALILNEFVFIKSLRGSNYQLSVLFQFSVIILVLSIFFNEFIKRTYNKKLLLRITGVISRFPFVFLLFFPRDINQLTANPLYHYIFLFIFLVYYIETPIINPIINLFLKSNYSQKSFGKLYSYATTIKKAVIFITVFAYGMLLDYDHFAFTYVFPVLSFLGILSVYLLSRIHFVEKNFNPVKKGFASAIKDSSKDMVKLMVENKPYRDFEIGFMFYGFAFMCTTTVITIFFDKALHLSYSSVAFYKNLNNVLSIILMPFAGRLLGRVDIRKFTMMTFFSLLFYIFFICLTQYYPYQFDLWGIRFYWMLFLAFVSFGIYTATMGLLWNIGSSYFCTAEDAGHYQSVHLFLTGVRGTFAPLLGVFFYELMGFTANFCIGMATCVIAIVIMILSMKKHKEVSQC